MIPPVARGFLFRHAVQGRRSPLPILRRLGFRTAREIETHRTALKVLRGDVEGNASDEPAARADRANRAFRGALR